MTGSLTAGEFACKSGIQPISCLAGHTGAAKSPFALSRFSGKMASSDPNINTVVSGGIHRNSEYLSLLTASNLTAFDSFLAIRSEKVVKRVRDDRQTVMVGLGTEGKPHEAYLKLSSYSWLKNLFNAIRKFTRQRGSLVHEYRNLVRLREIGVPSITPIAAGTRTRGLRCESFLLTDSLGPTTKLEDYVPAEFAESFSREKSGRKRRLIDTLARLTRKMHEGGVNHRDYYLCHIHILPDAEPWPRLFVIDLNRADRRAKVGRRWKVKDLAALNYSAPARIFSRADRLRFLKIYLAGDSPDATQRRFARDVLEKTARIAKHAVRSKARDSRYVAEMQKKRGAEHSGRLEEDVS